MPRARTLVGGYVRRFPGWTPLREAMASVLGITAHDIIDLNESGDPVVYLEARTQHGECGLRLEAFVDESRAPGFRGCTAFWQGLARALGQEVLYDDGASPIPTRWVLVQPDGARFEVFEVAASEGPDLLLDPEQPRRLLPDS